MAVDLDDDAVLQTLQVPPLQSALRAHPRLPHEGRQPVRPLDVPHIAVLRHALDARGDVTERRCQDVTMTVSPSPTELVPQVDSGAVPQLDDPGSPGHGVVCRTTRLIGEVDHRLCGGGHG
jgi:hypothetical protein